MQDREIMFIAQKKLESRDWKKVFESSERKLDYSESIYVLRGKERLMEQSKGIDENGAMEILMKLGLYLNNALERN